MPYVAPSTVTTLQTYTSAAHNVIVNDVIDHESRFKQYGSVTRNTAATGISATSFATASEFFSSDVTWTADGTSTYWIEFYTPCVITDTSAHSTYFGLSDGSTTQLAVMAQINGAASVGAPVFAYLPYTPSAGSRSVNIRVWVSANTSGVFAGNGGADFFLASLRVLGPA